MLFRTFLIVLATCFVSYAVLADSSTVYPAQSAVHFDLYSKGT